MPDFPQRQLIADYAGAPYVDAILDITGAGAGAANQNLAAAVQGLQQQADRSGQTIDQVLAGLGYTGDQISQLNTQLGGAFDTSGARDTLAGLQQGLGGAFDTAGAQQALTGMDFAGIQDRYQSDYTDQMVDPVLSRMREDEARRMAELEASGAAIGGGSNTRMAVEMARTTDEGMRSRAEMEAQLRNQALRQAQELGMQ